MDDGIRVSDADRERVAERLREHFAAGRLTSEELDERITATLSAKTNGDLRAVMTDLPEPGMTPPGPPPGPGWGMSGPAGGPPPWAMGGRSRVMVHRGPRLQPLVLLALIFALVLPGAGFVFFVFVKVVLAIFLVTAIIGLFTAARIRRRVRRYWQSGAGNSFYREWHDQWHGQRHTRPTQQWHS
jgi:hypothetical protein